MIVSVSASKYVSVSLLHKNWMTKTVKKTIDEVKIIEKKART